MQAIPVRPTTPTAAAPNLSGAIRALRRGNVLELSWRGSDVEPRLSPRFDVVFCLDTSSSMEGLKWEALMEALAFALSQLPETARFALTTFTQHAKCITPLQPCIPSEVDAALKEFRERAQPMGNTSIEAALVLAHTLLAQRSTGATRPATVVLVTDGDDPKLGRVDRFPAVREFLRHRFVEVEMPVAVHTLCIGQESNLALMTCIANETMGIVAPIPSPPDEVVKTREEVLEALQRGVEAVKRVEGEGAGEEEWRDILRLRLATLFGYECHAMVRAMRVLEFGGGAWQAWPRGTSTARCWPAWYAGQDCSWWFTKVEGAAEEGVVVEREEGEEGEGAGEVGADGEVGVSSLTLQWFCPFEQVTREMSVPVEEGEATAFDAAWFLAQIAETSCEVTMAPTDALKVREGEELHSLVVAQPDVSEDVVAALGALRLSLDLARQVSQRTASVQQVYLQQVSALNSHSDRQGVSMCTPRVGTPAAEWRDRALDRTLVVGVARRGCAVSRGAAGDMGTPPRRGLFAFPVIPSPNLVLPSAPPVSPVAPRSRQNEDDLLLASLFQPVHDRDREDREASFSLARNIDTGRFLFPEGGEEAGSDSGERAYRRQRQRE